MSNYPAPSSPHLGSSFMPNVQYPHYPFNIPPGNSQYRYPPTQGLLSQAHLPPFNVQRSGQDTNVHSFNANRHESNTPTAVTSPAKPPLSLGPSSSSIATRQSYGSAPVPNTLPASFSQPDLLQRQSSRKGVVAERAPDQLASQIHDSTIRLNELAGKVPDQPALHTAAMSDLEDGELSDGGSASEEAKLETERKRSVAKDALRQLYENQIGFLEVMSDIVLDGYSPTFLKQLYSEIGIPISSSDMAVASALEDRLGRNGSGNEVTAQKTERDKRNLNASPTPTTTQQATELRSSSDVDDNTAQVIPKNDSASESRVTKSKETKSTKASIQAIKPLPASSAASRNQGITPGSVAGIPRSAKSREKTFDRKDYIARMLAAKSSKSQSQAEGNSLASPSPKSSLSTMPPPADDPMATSQTAQHRNESTVVEGSLDQRAIPQRSPISEPRVNNAKTNASGNFYGRQNTELSRPELERTDAEAKKKAQTELARQKMEALKNREHLQRKDQKLQSSPIAVTVQLPPPSFPQTSATQANHPSVPANVKEHIPNPQPSYFFPVSGKQPFNLPGLFVSNGQLTNETPSQPSIALEAQAQPAVQSLSGVAGATSHSSPESSMPDVRRSPVPISDVTSKPTLTEESLGANAGNKQLINSARKRHKAADFLDPPTTRIKRHLGRSKDEGVVIEVSDDEAFDGLAGDDVRMEIDTEQGMHENKRERPLINSGTSQDNDRRLERRESDSLKPSANLIVTPPLAHTPGMVASLNGLNSMEKKIELMNRKIAELEQRRRAKQSSSRAQTPTAVGTRSTSPNLGQVVPDTAEKDQSTQHREEGPSHTIEIPVNDEADPPTTNAIAATKPVRLSGEASLKHVEQERETLVETERSGEIEAKRLQELEARQLIEAEQKRAKEFEDCQARKIEEQRARQVEEQRLRHLEQQRDKDQELARLNAERQQAVEAKESAQRQQNLDRKAAIKAGLPILDAEVDKTQQKLELLKQQVRELELELNRGIEGRRNLLEELQGLEATSLASANTEQGHRHVLSNQEDDVTQLNTEGSSSATPQRMDVDANFSTSGQRETSLSERRAELETVSRGITVPPIDGDVVEDTMDISRSDMDEGEIIDYSPGALDTREPETKLSIEHDNLYEPPPAPDTGADSSLPSRDDSREPGPPAVHGHAKSDIITDNATSLPNEYDRADQISDSSHDQSPSDSMSTGSEDYEPPEPVSPKESWSVSTRDQAINPKPTESIHVPQGNAQTADSGQQASLGLQRSSDTQVADDQPSIQKPLAEFEPKASHFTPYESPLKHFRSYRYHPEYAHDVVDGFRSLTYSHDIDAEKPMCHYELLGTCNDGSCKYQHLRSIKLSDDKILVQLGAAPAGLSHEEQDAYSRGLREVIRDIRARNIRDFNTVAAEITAYRARFLGDETKVLPL